MKQINKLLTALILTFGISIAYANDAKIGVVDLQKIMQTAEQMKEIQKSLEKDFQPRREKLVNMEKKIKQEMEKLKRDGAVMSEAKRKELEKKIVSEQRQFEQEGQQYQKQLSTAHNQAMETFYNQIREAISKIAKHDILDIVLQKDAAPYSSEKLDVTSRVLKEIK